MAATHLLYRHEEMQELRTAQPFVLQPGNNDIQGVPGGMCNTSGECSIC